MGTEKGMVATSPHPEVSNRSASESDKNVAKSRPSGSIPDPYSSQSVV